MITPELISTVGFPIVVCLYFMVKVEKTINNNTKALTDVASTIILCRRRK